MTPTLAPPRLAARLLLLLPPLLLPQGPLSSLAYPAEPGYQAWPPSPSSPSAVPQDYEMEDYRGKGCLDETGFVYGLGEEFWPGRSPCPCRCTPDGPVCPKPECPRFAEARCARVERSGCCPQCAEPRSECEHQGHAYAILQEFTLSPCERCRCESNGEVACVVAECSDPECVNPLYEPEQCCPICKNGGNCYAGTRIIPAGREVKVDSCTVCICPSPGGGGHSDRQATCVKRECQRS
ncbi:von Willebrand factor C domain-containing protein 2-like [Petromyzon marinus]|uniref:von Willebrand factor C domain-containing protein 2-like n=1 Tax=Petromyzon marinus TaxID=7757 RepID=A0AAJ7SWI8_PETMA|nr:von Willebrand factor C domain-containing protein 2-like [Petromyzon marinus]